MSCRLDLEIHIVQWPNPFCDCGKIQALRATAAGQAEWLERVMSQEADTEDDDRWFGANLRRAWRAIRGRA